LTGLADAGVALPTGWLWEDEGTYSRTTYANLFAAVTTTLSWRPRCSARLREKVKSRFGGPYLARTLLLFHAHEGFLRSMIGESLQLLL